MSEKAAAGENDVCGGALAAARQGPLSAAIVQVARLHRLLAGQLLREVGLHPGQELVMMELWERGRLRQVDLAQALGADSATVTRTVRRLEQAGFVRRIPSDTDKRSMLVEATAASLAARQKVQDLWGELEGYLTDELSEDEQSDALTVLRKLESALARHAPDGLIASR